MLCPAPLLAFIGRVMRGEIDAVSSTLTHFSWTGYERGNIYMLCPAPLLAFLGRVMRGEIYICCVQHPYSLFLDGL